ncbi:dual specificity protein phosphatase 10-like [Babylonia areolata]|uniref:dual specificity protein phosphatase 10-like n=1 Tax=Babylonia areolata TaxID=304850 RepID=UPI003FD4B754
MILIPITTTSTSTITATTSSSPSPHHHLHPHPLQVDPEFLLATPIIMPESSGNVEVLAPPRIHLASRRRFDLKLDLASAMSGRQRCEKKPRLELLTTSASLFSSKLSDTVSCGSCMTRTSAADDSPQENGTDPPCVSPTSCLGQTTCTFRPIRGPEVEERTSSNTNTSSTAYRTLTPSELASRLRKSRPIMVIDCRAFLCYNSHHVQGALNISCTDRFNRKRLQQGKVGVLELLAATHGRENVRRRHFREIVLYDGGNSQQQQQQQQQGLDNDSALHIVWATLVREGRQPLVLQGGMKQFEAEHPELCWSCRRVPGDMPARLLSSPTNDLVEPEIETATASPVLPFLYLGNERDAAELERLRRHNITYVLNVTAHVPQHWQAHGIRYKRIPASDSAQQNLKQYFEEAIEFIDDARQKGANVLIHCHAGVSRSATITIAYLLKHTRLAMGDAYKFVKAKRGIISPNFNFLGQLLEFEQDLNQGNALRVLNPRLVELESTV